MAPSHYLNQYWLNACDFLWHLPEDCLAENTNNISPWYVDENQLMQDYSLISQVSMYQLIEAERRIYALVI